MTQSGAPSLLPPDAYRLLFDSHPLPMWVYEVETLAFLAVNDAAQYQYGYSREEFLAMTIRDIRPPEDVPALLENIALPAPRYEQAGLWRHRHKDGRIALVEIISHELPFGERKARLVMAQEVTERKRLEAQLQQAQKMEGIGRLAGGIAHDFNNLLTAILGYAELTEAEIEADSPALAYLRNVQQAGLRAAELTRQLLAFARRQHSEPRILHPRDLLNTVCQAPELAAKEALRLTTEVAPDAAMVKVDREQMIEALTYLIMYACNAMPEGGTLTLTVVNARVEGGENVGDEAPVGDYVRLTVSDTGPGMSTETLTHLFEPFFSVQENSRGDGLGLATCYGIVKQNGGCLWATSEPGRGTTFTILLPSTAPETLPAGGRSEARPMTQGNETILLVEDEMLVRGIALQTLQAQGYTVLEAANGAEGLRLLESLIHPVDLIVTDVIMPLMGGRELVRQAQIRWPNVKALYVSGYSEGELTPDDVMQANAGYLQKPFTTAALAQKTRALLNENAESEVPQSASSLSP